MTETSTKIGMMTREAFAKLLAETIHMPQNRFHPLVWIIGEPEIGESVAIGGFSEVNARDAKIVIGDHCDIASFVSINCADSHMRCIGLADGIERRDIVIEDHVFIGSHSFVMGGAHIGHHSVIAAGTIVGRGIIPPYSLVSGNPMLVKPEYYRQRLGNRKKRP
jgi:acetyltransferase-like isoleucine patch superfamily enzyme